jgi:hypothetical protein
MQLPQITLPGEASAHRGQAAPRLGMPALHGAQIIAFPLGARHSTQACGSADCSAARTRAASGAGHRVTPADPMSNFIMRTFDSMR